MRYRLLRRRLADHRRTRPRPRRSTPHPSPLPPRTQHALAASDYDSHHEQAQPRAGLPRGSRLVEAGRRRGRGRARCQRPPAMIGWGSLSWWARTVSNRRHLPCKGSALPLSYAPGMFRQPTLPVAPGRKRVCGGRGRGLTPPPIREWAGSRGAGFVRTVVGRPGKSGPKEVSARGSRSRGVGRRPKPLRGDPS